MIAWPAIGVRQEPSSTARKARSAASAIRRYPVVDGGQQRRGSSASSARVSIATTPCPHRRQEIIESRARRSQPRRGRAASARRAPARSHRPRRHRACATGSRHCRGVDDRRSGRSRFTIACRRSEAVPTTAPCGSSRKVLAVRLMKTSRGSSRCSTRDDHEPVRQHGRHVLRRMHREVDRAGGERLLDLLGEQALAADLGERPVLDRVAGGADDRGPRCARPARRAAAARRRAHHAGLGERERPAARADPQDEGLRRLHQWTLQC